MKPLVFAALVFGVLFNVEAPALAQALDVPEYRTADEKLLRASKKDDDVELSFGKTITIERTKSNLVLCSEGAASAEDLASALVACDAAIAEKPDDGDTRYFRGFVLYHLEWYGEAEAAFTAAIENGASQLAESYYQRGVCKENRRRLREAAADFKSASDLKPDWSAARRKVDEYRWAYE